MYVWLHIQHVNLYKIRDFKSWGMFFCFVLFKWDSQKIQKKKQMKMRMAAFFRDAKECFPECLKPLPAGQGLRSLPPQKKTSHIVDTADCVVSWGLWKHWAGLLSTCPAYPLDTTLKADGGWAGSQASYYIWWHKFTTLIIPPSGEGKSIWVEAVDCVQNIAIYSYT